MAGRWQSGWIRRLGAALATAALAGCGGGRPAEGGTVVVGVRSDFSGLNPVTNTSIDTDQVLKYGLFTPLIQYDSELNPVPYLAEGWELEGDTAIVFRLRNDVKWHDGAPVTVEDVKFTFDLAKEPAAGSLIGAAYLQSVKSAEIVDSQTIRFRFTRPHAQAVEDFWWAPVPKHLLEGIPAAALRNAAFNRHPVGSGPFRFAEWRANDRLVIERNDSFPEALGGPPKAKRIVFRVIPEPATLLTELITGGIQVDIDVQPDQAKQVRETRSTTLHSYPGSMVFYLGWNNQRAPFDQVDVRRAMTYGIDRGEIIAALLFGYGKPATSTIPPWSRYNPGIAPLPYDTARARELLTAAGWVDRNHDGVRENAAGQPLRFALLTSERPLNRAVVEVVQNQLRKVGVQVEPQVLEFQTMLALHKSRNFDAVLSNWVLDNFQVASAPYALFYSGQANIPGSANRSGVRNARLDTLILAGAAATNEQQAKAIWAEFTRTLQSLQPFTFMFWLDALAGTTDAVSGVTMDQRGKFQSMPTWTVR